MACKYPIVLVHGLMIRHFKKAKAFGRIGTTLEKEGHTVFIATHDGFGSIENNAAQLKMFILQVLEKTGSEKVNIIAHSKGGLDIEYAITHLEISDKVASLTTLSTPHRGSFLASLIWRMPRGIKNVCAFFINGFYKLLGDKHPDALRACFQLRSRQEPYAWSVPDEVLCQSYSARMKRSFDYFILSVPHAIYKHTCGEENDGLVTPRSAEFGNYRGDALEGSVSHGELVDFFAKGKKRKRVLEFYKSVAKELEVRGR